MFVFCTNCWTSGCSLFLLQVEGSKSNDSYLTTEASTVRQSVKSVQQLANALNGESLDHNALVRIYWPPDRCNLLRDDVVLLDSPGVDVSPNVDDWIDKYCLDADVFVIVANAESTLTTTVWVTLCLRTFRWTTNWNIVDFYCSIYSDVQMSDDLHNIKGP